MQGAIINIFYSDCTYKKASCKGCYETLKNGSKILSVVRAQGKFTSVSNFCGQCAKKEVVSLMDEIAPLMKRIIEISETLDNEAKTK